ncbi:unnamed protein product [Prunus armeniaca]
MAMKQPHVVIFPFPLQGHMKPLLCLAELLCHAGLHVTYVNTHHNHQRLANRQPLLTHFPTLHFESISEDDPRTPSSRLLTALKTSIRPHRQDLPGFCRVKQADHPSLQFAINETQTLKRASALILDTVYELDAPCISHMALTFPKIYTLGPLHALLNSQIGDMSRGLASHGSLWKSDLNCMTWLDSQPSKSVIYVSFGTLVHLTRAQVIEFWYGLVNSGHPFLWVMKSDITSGDHQIPGELEKGTKERGYIVDWVSQEEVLAHKSVGGFLTHSGWNSTLESIVAGLPMICWPNLGDHYIISRTVCRQWKIGLQLNENCDRSNIESMVQTLMGPKREEIQSSMDAISKLARDSVAEGGSSHNNLEQLIEYIRNLQHQN